VTTPKDETTAGGRKFSRPWEDPIEEPEPVGEDPRATIEELLPADEDIPLSEQLYLSATTAEYRDLAEEIARSGNQTTPGPVAASMAGIGTGLIDFGDVTGQSGPSEEELEHLEQAATSDLTLRVISAVVLVGIFGVTLFLRGWLFTTFIGFLMVVALGEFYTTLRRQGFVPIALFGLAGMVGVAIAAHLGGPGPMLVTIVLAVLAVMAFYTMVPRRRPLDNAALTVFGAAWVSLLGFAVVIGRSPNAVPLILFLVLVVAIFDMGSFFAGRAMGRHPFAPELSPKKTWEGFIGGVVLATAAAAFLSTVDYFPLSLVQALLVTLLVVVLSPLGDAAESLVKRSLGVKDMGAVMPGHGGLLDRLDGLLFVVPAAYLFFRSAGLL
jgi:phosphatidate cytidylyltransferase